MSFVMLTDSHIAQPVSTPADSTQQESRPRKTSKPLSSTAEGTPLSDAVETSTRLFEVLSARSDIDHPICVECTELLIDGLQKRLASSTRERDAYVSFLRQANQDVPSDAEIASANRALKEAREKEEKAFAELESLEREKAALDDEIAALEAESRDLDDEEEAFWRSRNAFASQLHTFTSERDRLQTRYDHDAKALLRLQRTNVYNDTFNISHDGNYGTINGLRLGRGMSNTQQVDWPEINAAWGQTCLLLQTVAEQLGFKFQGYRLKPMGSTSCIIKEDMTQSASHVSEGSTSTKSRTTNLELYCTGDAPLGFGFLHRRFDNAMVAFLECLKQLGDFVEHASGAAGGAEADDGGLKMPYKIKADKIGDASIKLAAGNNKEWTSACKYTLTCCKYLLAHTSNVSSRGGRGGR